MVAEVDRATLTDDPHLAEIVRRLAEAFAPQRIYLFGSRARGDAHEDSDYDLMVVVADSDESRLRRAQRAYAHLGDIRVPKDVLVWTRDEFDYFLPVVASLPATIVREGRLVYGA